MRHNSAASRLRSRFISVADRLSELIKTLPVRRFKQDEQFVFVGRPSFYFGERSAEQQAAQFGLKREYETISELLKLLVRGGQEEVVSGLQEADNDFRDWLNLDGAWSVTTNAAENAKKVKAAAEPIERILDVLDAASKNDIILVHDTNSLLANADPTAYRNICRQTVSQSRAGRL
jgi:hypothetical protein